MRSLDEIRWSGKHGFTMIEVLVTMVITMIVVAAVFGLLQRGQDSFRREPEVADLNMNTRAGLDLISRDLLMAGLKTPPAMAVIWTDGGGITPDEITMSMPIRISRPAYRLLSHPHRPSTLHQPWSSIR